MKKLLSFILLLTLSLTFVACGGDDDEKKEPEKFVWGGDWNDPSDPNYKPEGYNPIQGLWKRDSDETKGAYFSEDFKDYKVTFFENGGNIKDLFKDKYYINDKAFRYSDTTTDTWRYKIEGNKLILYPNLSNDKDALSYIRIE